MTIENLLFPRILIQSLKLMIIQLCGMSSYERILCCHEIS